MNDQKLTLTSLVLVGLFTAGSVFYSKNRARRYSEMFSQEYSQQLERVRYDRIERKDLSFEGEYVQRTISRNEADSHDFDGDGINDFYIVFYDGEVYATLSDSIKKKGLEGKDFVRIIRRD